MKVERLYQVLREPHVTEKVTNLGERSNQYAFKVDVSATKKEVKEAVEQIYEVKVERVTTTNVKGKSVGRLLGRLGVGRRNNWKKAYVRLQEGQRIDFSLEV